MDDRGIQALFDFQEKKNSPERDYAATKEMKEAESGRIIVKG